MIVSGCYVPNTPSLIPVSNRHAAGFPEHSRTVRALKDVGELMLERGVETVVTVSPHFEKAAGIPVVRSRDLRQVYDYYGFPAEYYDLKYKCTGNPALAEQILSKAKEALVPCFPADDWGLDHGAWSPLINMFPKADVPVVPVGIARSLSDETHQAFGTAIRAASGSHRVAVVATGSVIHRLDMWGSGVAQPPDKAVQLLELFKQAVSLGKFEELWKADVSMFSEAAPEGGWKPLRVLAGSMGEATGRVLADEMELGAASLTTVLFEPK
ncbi:MAG: extradiol ring-cleavage dioxygenase [Thermoprotei archaeon]